MADTTLTQSVQRGESITAGRLARAGLIAAILATIANLLVSSLIPALFGFALEFAIQGPGSPVQPLPAFMVLMATIVPTTGAVLLLALLNRLTARPRRIFRIIAVVTLLLSLGGPLTVGAPLSVTLTLVAMHVLTAAIITGVLTRSSSSS